MMDSLERGLAELRADLSPSSADKARLRARILAPALAGDSYPQGTPPAPPALGRWAALKAAGSAGLGAGALLLGVGMGVGFWIGRDANAAATRVPAPLEAVPSVREASPPAASEPPEAPRASAEPARPEPAPVAMAAAPSEPRRSPPPRPRATRKAAVANPLNDELALLRRVERALRNADPALALALLRELDERFPESRLVEERQAAKLMADCRMQSADAVGRAHAFLSEHPASVYRQRVQLACAIDTAPAKQPDATSMKDAQGLGH